MKRNRFLAMLCVVALLAMSLCAALPAYADGEGSEDPAPAPAATEQQPSNPQPQQPSNPQPEQPSNPQPEQPSNPQPEQPSNPSTEQPSNPSTEQPSNPSTEQPSEPSTEQPTDPSTEQPGETPSGDPTEAPSGDPTEAPAGDPTEAPSGDPTEAPAEDPTEAPADPTGEDPAATETPTEDPDAETTPEPTEEAAPEPVKLSGLKAEKKEVNLGEKVTFTFNAENAESLTWVAKRTDERAGGNGSARGSAFEWKPDQSGVYTVRLTAVGADGSTAVAECELIVRDGPLKVSITAGLYARVDADPLSYEILVTGGVEPYSGTMTIVYRGRKVYTSKSLTDKLEHGASGYGQHKLIVKVKDAVGASASAEAGIVAADNAMDPAPKLPKLTKDMTLAERLVAVAHSQVGYHESKTNFIIRPDKSVQGWTVYGKWAGLPYEEWCAMFVSYCLEKAGIPEWMMPRCPNCNRWKNKLGFRYIDDEDNYIPEPGDLIFFHHDRVSKDPNFPNHVGIVVDYDEEKDWVYTVEGNTSSGVAPATYMRLDSVIVGYASIGYCMERWDDVYKQRKADYLVESRARLRQENQPSEDYPQASTAEAF